MVPRASVARIEQSESGADLEASPPLPDFAEPVIGPATSGRARWLNPGYGLNQKPNSKRRVGKGAKRRAHVMMRRISAWAPPTLQHRLKRRTNQT